jgi:hypothetical protein
MVHGHYHCPLRPSIDYALKSDGFADFAHGRLVGDSEIKGGGMPDLVNRLL